MHSDIRKIAIENLAILQTGDLPAILRYRRIFVPHRILPLSLSMRGIKGEGSSQKWPLPRLAGNLPVSPKIKVYFWGSIWIYFFTKLKQ